MPFSDEDKKKAAVAPATAIAAATATAQKMLLPIAKPQTAEEKRKCIKTLIEKIPTAKEELFAYPLEWNMVDSVCLNIWFSIRLCKAQNRESS